MDGDGDLAVLAGLDEALDELTAGFEAPAARAGGEAPALAALAAELRAVVPAPPPGAAERGRVAFLANAGAGDRVGRPRRRRSLAVRVAALAAAMVLLLAVPAAVARQARPGTTLWPLRQAGQQFRLALADGPVQQAHLRLNTAASYLGAGAGAGEERREDLADLARDEIRAAMDDLDDVPGPEAAAERSRAERLLLDVEALKDGNDPGDRSGSGAGTDDRSGSGSDSPGSDSSGKGRSGDD
jgi:uncharacterized membrane protein YgcG